ncbi:alkylated DNA nucleotide flippase Atl1 [Arthrobacter sp. AZCC_0090]|nr:alkylated DNA nucleotide flippase Atl1 [Arthrobacter sp. AZCC_0090]
MTTDLLSVSLCLSVVACSKRLVPFILCLVVLAKTGKTTGFQDIAVVFGHTSRDPRKAGRRLRHLNRRA